MNEDRKKTALSQLVNFLSGEQGKLALQVMKVSKEDLLEALDALTEVLVKYDNIPDKTWAFLLHAMSEGARIHGKGANPRSNLG